MRRLLANGFVQQEIRALEEQLRLSEDCAGADGGLSSPLKQRRPKMASRRRKDYVPRKNSGAVAAAHVLFEGAGAEWRRLKTCCGLVMEHRELSLLLVDVSAMSACAEHTTTTTRRVVPQPLWGVQTTTTALKKHQLYLNRALLSGDLQYATTIPACEAATTTESKATVADKPGTTPTTATAVLDLSEKLAEFSKGLVQRVAETNKFSDNSSDSGYEELSSGLEVPPTTTGAGSQVALMGTEATIELKKVVVLGGGNSSYPLTPKNLVS